MFQNPHSLKSFNYKSQHRKLEYLIPSNKQLDSPFIDDESVLVGLFEDLETRINNLEALYINS